VIVPGDPIRGWPGEDRRYPSISDRHYLALAPLAHALCAASTGRLAGRGSLAILDIGCGEKPYMPFFLPYAATYRGLDAEPGPFVDDVGRAEELPYSDASFDVVLCTQVLEHVDDPGQTVAEIHRVLRPNGLALLSTHGVFLYHPDPPESDRDYWRWTHAGLRRLFAEAGSWSTLDVEAQGDVVACLGYIACQFVDEGLARVCRPRLRRLAIGAFNRFVKAIDDRYPPRARFPAPGSMSANYLVAAVKTGGTPGDQTVVRPL
jgi:SAM-dependent methyltransferase